MLLYLGLKGNIIIKMIKGDNVILEERIDKLFKYISPIDNDKLSKLNKTDLCELLKNIQSYYLKLRNCLGFDNYVTIGLEIEFENSTNEIIKKKLKELNFKNHWDLKLDGTLDNGGEITSDILFDTKENWDELKRICFIVKENAMIGKNSGAHIHIGTQVLGDKDESWKNFLSLWEAYENIIYRFSYGEYLNARDGMLLYSKTISKKINELYKKINKKDITKEDIIKYFKSDRNQAVNFENVVEFYGISYFNTIEFRCPNGTLNPVIWQNNVNLFVNLLKYSKSDKYNADIVKRRRIINGDKFINCNPRTTLELYSNIYLEQALELCDMIFNNNLDKIYFLRQYLKSYQTNNKELSKVKTFTIY